LRAGVSFAESRFGLLLGIVCQQYSLRPSAVLEIDDDLEAFLLDSEVALSLLRLQTEPVSVAEKIRRRRRLLGLT